MAEDDKGNPERKRDLSDRASSTLRKAMRHETEDYIREKQEEGRALSQPAEAEHDPEWESKDHLDPKRATDRPRRDGAAKDAVGQAERGSIDQTITSDGNTETR